VEEVVLLLPEEGHSVVDECLVEEHTIVLQEVATVTSNVGAPFWVVCLNVLHDLVVVVDLLAWSLVLNLGRPVANHLVLVLSEQQKRVISLFVPSKLRFVARTNLIAVVDHRLVHNVSDPDELGVPGLFGVDHNLLCLLLLLFKPLLLLKEIITRLLVLHAEKNQRGKGKKRKGKERKRNEPSSSLQSAS